MGYFYSATTGGFYPEELTEVYELSEEGWPADAVPVTDEDYASLFAGRDDNKVIIPDDKGYPVLSAPPEPTQEQMVDLARARKATLMDAAGELIAPLADAEVLGVITDDEATRLRTLRELRVQLNRIDAALAPAIDWPEMPSDVA